MLRMNAFSYASYRCACLYVYMQSHRWRKKIWRDEIKWKSRCMGEGDIRRSKGKSKCSQRTFSLYICADAVTEHRILFYIFHFKICTFVRMWNMHTQSILLLECVLINEKCYQASIIESLCVHWGNDVDDDNFF